MQPQIMMATILAEQERQRREVERDAAHRLDLEASLDTLEGPRAIVRPRGRPRWRSLARVQAWARRAGMA